MNEVTVKAFAWTVLTLVFADEVLALAAAAAWGLRTGGIPLAVAAPAAWAGAWFLFAAPQARFGGRITTPAVKVAAFGLACLALRAAAGAEVPMPFASVLQDHLLEALATGKGHQDWAALADIAARHAGLPRAK